MSFSDYYHFLSTLTRDFTQPIGDLADTVNIPLFSALLFGLIGALAPCQLSSNLAALAWVSRGVGSPGAVARSSAANLLGKATVYTLVGSVVIQLGLQLQQSAIPVIVAARKAMGPLLILAALMMFGLFKLNISLGHRIGAWFERHAAGKGVRGAYLLGVAFAFAFCPTLFWLFFGLTLPLAISSAGGIAFPAVFAAGTTIPLFLLATLIATGAGSMGHVLARARRLDVWVTRAAAAVFLLVGLNETVLYWLL